MIDKKEYERYKARANIFKAIAHPARLFIIHELSRGEKCVSELTEMLGMDASTVSRHLSVLKNAGIIDSEKKGTQVFYYLRIPCLLNFCGCIEKVLKTSAEEKLSLVE